MTKSVTHLLSGDRNGMLVAALCVVHCVAGPVLLSIAGFSSLIGLSERIEPVFLLSSVTFGVAILIPAYRKRHRRLSCLALFLSGILCLMIRRYMRWNSAADIIAVAVGASIVIGAHALNLKFSKQCECCKRESSGDSLCPSQK